MAESCSQARPRNSSQYHHFVPRFLLRNFAVFKNPGKVVQKTSKNHKNRPPRPQRLNVLNLKSGAFEQKDVGETFGIVDMYRDFEKAGPDQQKLEKELSVLESAAGVIVARVTKAYEAGKKEVQLVRKDRDILRRFLFIMMYRNSNFAQRFQKSRADYDSDDRESMLVYMDERGFKSPRDVWFANIRAFLEAKFDEDWTNAMEQLSKRAYPTDARWFYMHIQAFFTAFCTPKRADDEFLLTQNVYGVYEGPTSAGPWTDYHRFAPVSSKIMIVLRSTLLPCVGVKDEDDNRQMLLDLNKSMHLNPDEAGSCLEDLPVNKARNNCSQIIDGRVESLPTKVSRDKHIFYFPFFYLDHEHVQKVNMICLENASDTAVMVYKSQESLRTALEFYLTDKTPGFKVTWCPPPVLQKYQQILLQGSGHLAHAQRLLPYLQVLHNFATQLGSTVELRHNPINRPETAPEPAMIAEQGAWYEKLGGSQATLLEDFDQAKRIVQLITKVDTLIQEYSPEVKYVVRQNRDDLIFTLPPRRVWLSVKQLRSFRQGETHEKNLRFQNRKDKEDIIVDASHVFKPDSLARIIYTTFYIDHFLKHQPDYGVIKPISFDDDGAKRMRQELELVFNKPGSICNCGIPAVEAAAEWVATQPLPGRETMTHTPLHRVISDKQWRELCIRLGVEAGFDELLKDDLGSEELRALKDVLFKFLYRLDLGTRMPARSPIPSGLDDNGF